MTISIFKKSIQGADPGAIRAGALKSPKCSESGVLMVIKLEMQAGFPLERERRKKACLKDAPRCKLGTPESSGLIPAVCGDIMGIARKRAS